MVAGATQIPELALDKSEASQLASALKNVEQYYPMKISGKTLAWINLCMVAGSVYGARIVAYSARVSAEKPVEQPPNIYPIAPQHIPN
jgi:hypothetical protein